MIQLAVLGPVTYSWRQIQDVAEFQNHGGSGLPIATTKRLFDRAVWPKEYMQFSGKLYRILGLELSDVQLLLADKPLVSKQASSWTKSKQVAIDFMGHSWFSQFNNPAERIAVLLEMTGAKECLDIDRLHRDESFSSNIAFFEDKGKWFSEGLDYKDEQQEVALPPGIKVGLSNVAGLYSIKDRKWLKPSQVENPESLLRRST